MPIYCRIIAKKNPADSSGPEKYYLNAKSINFIGREELIDDMVRHTSLTRQEASTGVDYLFESVPRFLKMGYTVQLGNIGYFKVTLRSEGSETPEEATLGKVNRIRVVFMVGRKLREEADNYPLERFPV